VAMYLILIEQGVEFEAIYVDHGTDWPENYRYVYNFAEKYPLTILYPDVEPTEKTEGFHSLYEYCYYKKIMPSMKFKWCSDKFKVQVINRYVDKPCFMNIGFDAGETRRVKINYNNGIENRFPLIENGINRAECKKIIKKNGLPIPTKSGCFICPWQSPYQFKKLRMEHPDLFCMAERLENIVNKKRKLENKRNIYLCANKAKLGTVVDENQIQISYQHSH